MPQTDNPFLTEAKRRQANAELTSQGSVMAPQARSAGVFGDVAAGFGTEIMNLLPGEGATMRPPDTVAADIGAMLPETLASFAVPGARMVGVASQGALAAAFSMLRNPDDPLGAGFVGGLTGAATGVGDVAGRSVKGIAERTLARIRGSGNLIRTRSQALRTLSETLGGSGGFNKQQQSLVNRSWVEALGETGDSVTPAVRNSAAKRIGAEMDAALPTGPVDIQPALSALDEIPADRIIGHKALQSDIGAASRNPKSYQETMATLRKKIRTLARTDAEAADALAKVMDNLGEAGTAAGAANTRVVREQYKNLMLLESIPTVRRTGSVPPLSAEGKIFSKFGGGTARSGGTGTLPATQNAISTTQEAAEELSQRFRSSGTAERGVQAEAAQDVMGVLTGQTSPSRLLRTLGSLALIGPLAGAAAIGKPAGVAGRAAAFGARELDKRLLDSNEDNADSN